MEAPESSVDSQVEHFRSIPWCRKILDRPDQVIGPTHSRRRRDSTQSFFCRTLNTPSTVSEFLVFYDRPRPGEAAREVRTLITLGADVAGHKGVCHGGMVVSILDEVAGELGGLNQHVGAIPKGMLVTAYLNTKFLAPLMVPSTVFARAWGTRSEGRKHFVEVVIEDENGVAVASAEALFMGVREKGKL